MKYIPKKSNNSKRVSISFYDNTFLKMTLGLDPVKISKKYAGFHSSTSVDFLDEDGFEYHVVIGTKTSLIRDAIVRTLIEDIVNMPANNDEVLRKRTVDFVQWLKTQGVNRIREGD
jgi:hypothetical protein